MKVLLGEDKIKLKECIATCQHWINQIDNILKDLDEEDARDFELYDLLTIKVERLYDEAFDLHLFFNPMDDMDFIDF